MTVLACEPSWTISPALTALRARVLSWTPEQINTGWEDILVAQGAAELACATGDEALLEWVRRWKDFHLEHGVHFRPQKLTTGLRVPDVPPGMFIADYCGNWGMAFALDALRAFDGDEQLADLTLSIATQVERIAHRASDNTITHGGFSENIWVDTLYYAAPTFAAAYRISGNSVWMDRAIEQCQLHAKYLRDPHTGLYHHDADPETGCRTVNYWGRGNGWIIAALADVMRTCPETHPRSAVLTQLYRDHAESLMPYRCGNSMWRVVPELADSHQETSATAMILTGLAHGVLDNALEGYVTSVIRRGWQELQTWITADGRLMGSQHPTGRGGWDALKLTDYGEDSYTTGFFMRLCAAMFQLDRQ